MLGMMVYTSNPSYSGGEDRRTAVHNQPGQKGNKTISQKTRLNTCGPRYSRCRGSWSKTMRSKTPVLQKIKR
jgi:hypothetical protein